MFRDLLLLAPLLAVAAYARPFDYFLLVREWPAGICDHRECTHIPKDRNEFTIHGLWPNYADGSWPQFCDSSELDTKQIKDLLPDLRYHWPSLFTRNTDFWNHEWMRHGTCASPVLKDEHEYFSTILDLHKKWNIDAPLLEAGIVPSPTTEYPVVDIKKALKDAYGVAVEVHCNYHKEISEVWFCVGRDLKLQDCHLEHPGLGYPHCDKVLYPPMKDDVARRNHDRHQAADGHMDKQHGPEKAPLRYQDPFLDVANEYKVGGAKSLVECILPLTAVCILLVAGGLGWGMWSLGRVLAGKARMETSGGDDDEFREGLLVA